MRDALERWGPRLAPALLLAVALHQMVLACTESLNPWKGGGFGMFATSDRGGLRDVRAFLRTPQGEEPLPVPADLEGLRLRVRDLPSDAALRALGRELLARAPRQGDVRIEVGLRELDLDAGRMRRRVLRERLIASADAG